MEHRNHIFSKYMTVKWLSALFLFCYFGFIMIPQWTHPFSFQFTIWIICLPFVVITLLLLGIQGGIGLWQEKSRNAPPNPQHKFFVWLAGLGLLWFLISIALARVTAFAYNHQKFDSERWKTSSWEGGMFELALRERMLDDLMQNVLPGHTKTEVIDLLGQPDDTDGEEILFYYTGWNIMEPKCLFLKFDEQGIMQEYYHTVCG